MAVNVNNGSRTTIRILIDQGSEVSLISEETVHRLKLSRTTGSIPLAGIGNLYAGHTRGIVSLTLHSLHQTTLHCQVRAYILNRLTARQPNFEGCPRRWPHLQNLKLADPDFDCPGPIHLVLGSDAYGQVICPGLIKADAASPIAQKTIFGWILSGPVSSDKPSTSVHGFVNTVDTELQDCLAKFWTQEEIPDAGDRTLTEDERECERHFAATHSQHASGRYIVRLPLKGDPKRLGDSRSAAFRSIRRLISRERQQTHRINYNMTISSTNTYDWDIWSPYLFISNLKFRIFTCRITGFYASKVPPQNYV